MAKKSWETRYVPPDIALFGSSSVGLLGEAFVSVQHLEIGVTRVGQWLDGLGAASQGVVQSGSPEDLVSNYVNYAFALDCIERLEDMSASERQKHLALSPHVTLAAVEERLVNAAAFLAALELRQPEAYQHELDRRIFQGLDVWEACLRRTMAKNPPKPEEDSLYSGELDEDAPRQPGMEYVTWSDFFSGRTNLQWLLVAITKLRYLSMEDEDAGVELRLRRISPFEIEERLRELDALLRKVLNGRKDKELFWLGDPAFWWCEFHRDGKQSR